MVALLCFFLTLFASLFKSKSRLEAETGPGPWCVGIGPASGGIGAGNLALWEAGRKSMRTCGR
jgi:hypothetical protein